jgi:hypothetical protein
VPDNLSSFFLVEFTRCRNCSIISPLSRLRFKPRDPVLQKTQPAGQPTCVERQAVRRFLLSLKSTASINASSSSFKIIFFVVLSVRQLTIELE